MLRSARIKRYWGVYGFAKFCSWSGVIPLLPHRVNAYAIAIAANVSECVVRNHSNRREQQQLNRVLYRAVSTTDWC